ncbi:MAG TPA: hypothetical protein VNR62_07655 [Cellulomonas sp.]|nr:hypothetical protein [Cellulomonas sp.]
MTNMTVKQTYAFEPRQRSLAPVATTLQGRPVSTGWFISAGFTSAHVTKPIGGTTAKSPVTALTSTDPRLHRTSPL